MKVTLFRDLPSESWWSMERYADELERALRAIGVKVRRFVLPRPGPRLRGRANAWLNLAWRYTAYTRAARGQQGDVNHILDHSYAHLLEGLEAHRTVVTCHDIAPLAQNEGRGLTRRLWEAAFRQMQNASQIITISHATREAILRLSAIAPERLTPIWYGVGSEFAPQPYLQPASAPLLAHIGSCASRKNVEAIIHALPSLRDIGVKWTQVGGSFTPAQRKLIARLEVHDLVQQIPPVFGSELSLWYHRATVLVFPSIYEGFGLPVLEAMASGTPVICSNVSSLPEVAGDAALLVDPHDTRALVAAIRRVLGDESLRRQLVEHGLARARTFTWEQTARETLAVYQRVRGEA